MYKNKDEKLPKKKGGEWYEADAYYYEGHRSDNRIVYSNDG